MPGLRNCCNIQSTINSNSLDTSFRNDKVWSSGIANNTFDKMKYFQMPPLQIIHYCQFASIRTEARATLVKSRWAGIASAVSNTQDQLESFTKLKETVNRLQFACQLKNAMQGKQPKLKLHLHTVDYAYNCTDGLVQSRSQSWCKREKTRNK